MCYSVANQCDFHSDSWSVCLVCDQYIGKLSRVCCCGVLSFNPEPAQGLLSRAGHLGDVWEEPGALRGILESCTRDVAEILRL